MYRLGPNLRLCYRSLQGFGRCTCSSIFQSLRDVFNSEHHFFILAGFLEKRAEESGDLAAAAAIYDECAQLYTISDGVDSEF